MVSLLAIATARVPVYHKGDPCGSKRVNSVKMKLRYTIQKTSILSTSILNEKIILVLKELDYALIKIDSNFISFNLEGWGSTAKQVGKVNGGTFEITLSDNERIVKFDYYFSFTLQLFLIPVFIALSFWEGIPFLILSIFAVIVSIIGVFIAKAKCQEILIQITETNL